MKKILFSFIGIVLFIAAAWYAFVFFVPYSTGTRAGELVKFSKKGVVSKTWEGEMSQGMSGVNIFSFSVMDSKGDVIDKLREYQGKFVKVEYMERYGTFFWWGDTQYFITDVTLEQSPFFGGSN